MPRRYDPTKQPAGHLMGPMQWLVPRYSQPPGTLIRLGSILTDPGDLESSLNLDAIPPIPQEFIRDASTAVRRQVVAEMGKGDGVFVKALPPGILTAVPGLEIGAQGGAGREETVRTTLVAEKVRASVFTPGMVKIVAVEGDGGAGVTVVRAEDAGMEEDEEGGENKDEMEEGEEEETEKKEEKDSRNYVDVAIEHPKVKEYVAGWGKNRSLYMIVGVATALGGVTIGEERSKEKFAELGGTVAIPAGLGEGELSLEHKSHRGGESTVEIEEECDFAYRVREFTYSRIPGWRRLKDRGLYTDGALFGRDKKTGVTQEREQEDNDIALQFEWFEDEDEEPGVEGVVSFEVEVDDDEDEEGDEDDASMGEES